MEISCIVLAGGRSSRLGHDKIFKNVGDRNLLELVINCIAPLSREMILVAANNNTLARPDRYPALKIVTDVQPGKGPLGGIYTGLLASKSSHNLVVASDMPFLNRDLLQYMIKVAADSALTVPRVGDLSEPLHAIYTKNCLEPIQSLLRQGELSVRRLFSMVRTRYVEAEEIERFDPQHLSFFNINTRADLLKAEEISRGIAP